MQHLRIALRLNPDSAETNLNLGIALAEMGNTREAAAHLKNALRLDPQLNAAQIWLDRLTSPGK